MVSTCSERRPAGWIAAPTSTRWWRTFRHIRPCSPARRTGSNRKGVHQPADNDGRGHEPRKHLRRQRDLLAHLLAHERRKDDRYTQGENNQQYEVALQHRLFSAHADVVDVNRSEEHTSELQSPMYL